MAQRSDLKLYETFRAEGHPAFKENYEHQEYPKYVKTSKGKVVANSEAEEKQILADDVQTPAVKTSK